MLRAQPKVDNATPSGIINAAGPNTRLPNSTATAGALIISAGDKTVIYAKFINTYKAVIIGTAIEIDRGIFLKEKKTFISPLEMLIPKI